MLKDIEDFDGKYSVSSDGYIVNNNTGNTIYGSPDKNGYYKVRLYHTAKDFIDRFVHRLVAIAFLDYPANVDPDSFETLSVIHIDGVKSHNNLENLEWSTFPEAVITARAKGKYTDSDLSKGKPVMSIDNNGKKVKYKTVMEAARAIKEETGTDVYDEFVANAIRQCANGITKQSYGRSWKYTK